MLNRLDTEAHEFTGKIEHGAIRLPKEFETYENTSVRVIMLIEQPKPPKTQKEKLQDIIRQMARIPMFRKLELPVRWQQQMRDEWA
jgi:hypothetical protein